MGIKQWASGLTDFNQVQIDEIQTNTKSLKDTDFPNLKTELKTDISNMKTHLEKFKNPNTAYGSVSVVAGSRTTIFEANKSGLIYNMLATVDNNGYIEIWCDGACVFSGSVVSSIQSGFANGQGIIPLDTNFRKGIPNGNAIHDVGVKVSHPHNNTGLNSKAVYLSQPFLFGWNCTVFFYKANNGLSGTLIYNYDIFTN